MAIRVQTAVVDRWTRWTRWAWGQGEGWEPVTVHVPRWMVGAVVGAVVGVAILGAVVGAVIASFGVGRKRLDKRPQ